MERRGAARSARGNSSKSLYNFCSSSPRRWCVNLSDFMVGISFAFLIRFPLNRCVQDFPRLYISSLRAEQTCEMLESSWGDASEYWWKLIVVSPTRFPPQHRDNAVCLRTTEISMDLRGRVRHGNTLFSSSRRRSHAITSTSSLRHST